MNIKELYKQAYISKTASSERKDNTPSLRDILLLLTAGAVTYGGVRAYDYYQDKGATKPLKRLKKAGSRIMKSIGDIGSEAADTTADIAKTIMS